MSGTRIGFIGLGAMGFHMATRLAEAGYPLAIFDVRKDVLESFQGDDVSIHPSSKEVADHAEIVLASLPSPGVSKEVALGQDGLIHGSRIKIYIDLSTTGESAASEIGEALLSKGIQVLDSPVSGGVPGAQKGTLSIMIAGDKAVYDQCHPMLSRLGSKIFYIGGKVGQAQAMKVINNLLSSAALALTSEAMVLGVKAGLDPSVMIDVLNVSTGRNSATQDKFKQFIINRKFDYGFKTSLAYKDIKLYQDLAEKLQVPLFMGSNIVNFWRYVLTQGGNDEDSTCVIKYIEQWAGVEVAENHKKETN
ncbi:NAD(P)-dependent oxidoreductase [Ferviditalea candida]|uniref:NAD(P)-dependent oxidoreductase n=1 Tax=Ferviditalea candida TaxID=3108399 RepID=A0ABU5ZEI5_9BACL|nr:NAD(P)-dependent oxidoreductase [Paenibacillaceae bacterium T2]